MKIELMTALFEATLATSVAVLLVFALRPLLLRRLGASVAYAAWALVPAMGLAVLLPAPQQLVTPMSRVAQIAALPTASLSQATAYPSWATVLLGIWLLGVLCSVALLVLQQRRFLRGLGAREMLDRRTQLAQVSEGLPAVVGLLRVRIVLPADFDTRYGPDERELILCHERIHIARQDLWANALAVSLRALLWFNPLLYFAVARFSKDQELACDERVIARYPQSRRLYADAMLKTQMSVASLPVGCHWPATHPLKERIAMLKEHSPKASRRLSGAVLVGLLLLGGGYGAWAAQPKVAAVPEAELYQVKINLVVDGEAQQFEVREHAGKRFSFVTKTKKGHEWKAEFDVRKSARHPAAVVLSGELTVDGVLQSSPVLEFRLGNKAKVQVSNNDGSSLFDMDALVNAIPGLAARGSATSPVAKDQTAAPPYPADLADKGISGKVVLLVDVAADGSVTHAEVERSEPQGVFDAITLEAAKQWRFTPRMENGKAVPGRVRVPVDFDAGKQRGSAGAGSSPAGEAM